MKIGDYNLRAFVMTLQEMPERTDFIMRHFKEVGIEAENFNCFSAAASGLLTAFPYEVDAPDSRFNMGPKLVNNWISHYSLWTAMSYMPEEHFLSLEWDTHFQPDWRIAVEQAMLDVPKDFDLLYLGSCCADDKPRTPVRGRVWMVQYPQCQHAYVIAKKALPVMLRTQRKCYAPMDISLVFHTMPLLKVYTVLPRIADQFNTNIPP